MTEAIERGEAALVSLRSYRFVDDHCYCCCHYYYYYYYYYLWQCQKLKFTNIHVHLARRCNGWYTYSHWRSLIPFTTQSWWYLSRVIFIWSFWKLWQRISEERPSPATEEGTGRIDEKEQRIRLIQWNSFFWNFYHLLVPARAWIHIVISSSAI